MARAWKRTLLGALLLVLSVDAPAACADETGATREGATAGLSISGEEPLLGRPVDAASYRLGPGDVLVLAVPGVLRENVILVVDAEGGIVLPGSAGRVEVAALTLEEARRAVGKALASLVRRQAFALSLQAPRRFKVYVVGAVEKPGVYAASPVTRVSEIVDLAGGILAGGSKRNLTVERSDSLELRADLVAFAALGDQTKNLLLEGGDVVRVPVRTEEMAVFGGVATPGVYEFVAGETVESAIVLAGGLVPGAERDKAWVSRLGSEGSEARQQKPADPLLNLTAGDAVVVPVIGDFGRVHAVEVMGEVQFPGSYPIVPGVDTVADVLKRAGGLTAAANPASARLLRAPPNAISGGRPEVGSEVLLERPAAHERKGAGAAPPLFGELPETAREMELLRRGDARGEVKVAWLGDPLSDPTPVEDGDLIQVPRASGRVRVEGRVRSPGWVAFTPGREAKHYVELAGGFDRSADRSHVLVQRAGRPAQAERARGSRALNDGDTVWVPEKAPRGGWARVRDAVALLAQVATIVLVVTR